jgi:hypothetical protein
LVYQRWHGNPANLERKITTPGVQLPIRKVSIDARKKLEEYGVLKNSP